MRPTRVLTGGHKIRLRQILPRRIAWVLMFVWIASLPVKVLANSSPLIAAASDLQFALTEIAAMFQSRTGQSVRLTFGSSGNFARQIRQGAPYEIYFSADEQYALDLYRDGFARGPGAPYGIGRVVIIAPKNSSLQVDSELQGLRTLVKKNQLKRFAIANPDHAPYGKRARELLRFYGLWDTVNAHLVLGENISQAAQFATSPNTQGGIIAYSLALSPRVSAQAEFAIIPQKSHTPLRQRMILLNPAGYTAEKFFAFVLSKEARLVLRRYGFSLPDEGS